MSSTNERQIAGVWEMQHYLAFQDDGTFGDNLRVTEDTSFETTNDDETYEPKYLDRKVQPSYVMGRKTTIKLEVDAVLPGSIQAALYAAEDELNVPVLYTRTIGVDFATGQALPSTALRAKQARGTLVMDPLKGEASGPAKLSGTVTLAEEYAYGTFDATTGTFTPDAADAQTPDATLSALAIGSLELTPAFAAGTTAYAASTTNASDTVTATAADEGATVEITLGESTEVENGGSASWSAGANTLTVTVTNGSASTSYVVTVTKS